MPELPQERLERFANMGIRKDSAQFLVQNKDLGDMFEQAISKDKALDSKKFAIYLLNTPNITKVSSLEKAIKNFKARLEKDDVDMETIRQVISDVIKLNPKAVEDYKSGKQNAIQFLLGQFMKTLKKRVDVKIVIEELKKVLD